MTDHVLLSSVAEQLTIVTVGLKICDTSVKSSWLSVETNNISDTTTALLSEMQLMIWTK